MSDIYVYVCIYPYSASLLVYSIVISDLHLVNITERVTVQHCSNTVTGLFSHDNNDDHAYKRIMRTERLTLRAMVDVGSDLICANWYRKETLLI